MLLRPEADEAAEVAKLTDRQLGDELMVVRFVKAGEAATPTAH